MDIDGILKDALLKLGMWWPDADADQLREAASAWRAFAESVDDVTAATHKAARSVIDGNEGQSIEAFADFWARYHKGAKTGWLDDLAESARSVAKSLDMYADAVDEAISHLWTEIGIAAAALGAGVLLAIVTGGAGAVAGSAAAEGVISAAASIGVTVSAEIAGVIGTTMAGVAFGSIESIAVDLAVAQPLHIAAGDQESINVDQAAAAGVSGAVAGGVFGAGAGAVAARGMGSVDSQLATSLNSLAMQPSRLRPAADFMGKRSTWKLYWAPDSDALAAPARVGDDLTPSGHPIYHGKTRTTLGYDSRTMSNLERVQGQPGLHDVVVHGTRDEVFVVGHVNPSGADRLVTEVSPHQIVEAIRNNPNYDGGPVRLISCHSGAGDNPLAQSVANDLGVPVTAPTNRMGVDSRLGVQEPLIDRGGYWRTFLPLAN